MTRSVVLYEEARPGVSLEAVAKERPEYLPPPEIAGRLPARAPDLASRIAACRVLSPTARPTLRSMAPVERKHEERVLVGEARPGALYDGVLLSRVWLSLLAPEERHLDRLVVVLTGRLAGSFDTGERRYHARAVIAAHPVIVSVPGILAGPALPPAYYMLRREPGMDEALLRRSLGEEVLQEDDPLMPKAVASYIAQAAFHRWTGEGACADRACILFNAHKQEDVIRSKVNGRLCATHRETASSLRGARAPRA